MKRVVLFLLVTALTACAPRYEAITFALVSQPPIPVRVEFDAIEIPIGIAVSVHAELESSSRIEYVEDDQLDLVSGDRGIFLVESTEDPRNFVFVGVALGNTCLSVLVDHQEEECIPVRVTPDA